MSYDYSFTHFLSLCGDHFAMYVNSHGNPDWELRRTRPELYRRALELVRRYERGVNLGTIADIDMVDVARRYRNTLKVFKFRMSGGFVPRESFIYFLNRIVRVTRELLGEDFDSNTGINIVLIFPDRDPIGGPIHPYEWYSDLDNLDEWWETRIDAAEESEGELYIPIVFTPAIWYQVIVHYPHSRRAAA